MMSSSFFKDAKSDLILRINDPNDPPSMTFYVERQHLQYHSTVIRDMLQIGSSEKNETEEGLLVVVLDDDEDDSELLLEYVIPGKVRADRLIAF
jgi:hypothetical protein